MKQIDRYEVGMGLTWSDGWRYIAKDGDGTTWLFSSVPEMRGKGRNAQWIALRGRKARMPFHVRGLSQRTLAAIDWSIDRRLSRQRHDRDEMLAGLTSSDELTELSAVDATRGECLSHALGGGVV